MEKNKKEERLKWLFFLWSWRISDSQWNRKGIHNSEIRALLTMFLSAFPNHLYKPGVNVLKNFSSEYEKVQKILYIWQKLFNFLPWRFLLKNSKKAEHNYK